MESPEKLKQDAGETSSDGEEDFESADEGEGKGKVNRVSASVKDLDSTKSPKKSMKGDDEVSCKNVSEENGSICSADDLSKRVGSFRIGHQVSELNSEAKTANKTAKLSPELKTDCENLTETSDASPGGNLEATTKLSEANNDKTTESNVNEKQDNTSSGWGWGAWGAAINQATASVTSGLSHVIEKVETTLGIPEPGELDEVHPKQEEKEVITTEPRSAEMERGAEDNNDDGRTEPEPDKMRDSESFLSSWGLSSLSNAVTSKGLELVSEGIDALEMIGKKTMNVIAEGDPGLRSRRSMFQKTTLSQVLREAKEKTAKEAAERKKQEVLEKVNFNDEFDRYQGLAHLEALEILSRESEGKIESILIDLFQDDLEKAKAQLRCIEDVFEKEKLSDEESGDKESHEEFAVEIGKCAMALNLGFVPDKLNQTEDTVSEWLEECVKDQEKVPTSRIPEDIYTHVITSLANITAKSIEVFRKVAEMILLKEMEEETVTAEHRAIHLSKLTKVVTNRISSLSTSYAQCLNTAVGDSEDNDNITPIITEVYLECSNSSSHVQDAFKLLLPILQVSALNNFKKELK